MPFPRKLLNDHESVAVDLHPHGWFFAPPAAALVAAIVLSVATLTVTEGDSTARTALGWVSLAALVGAALWLVVRYLRWRTTHFVITSDRVISRTGVVAKSGVEIPLERVNTVHFSQGLFERIVGSGDLVIESGGEDGQQRFTDIRRPARVQRELHTQLDHHRRRRFAVAADGARLDVAGQLERLEGMLERGTLSQDEFDAQKARLLGGT